MPQLTALVIGNADYKEAVPLKNPTNDAEDVAKKLEEGGFDVTTLTDATNLEMHKALKAFEKSCEHSDVALFFFAGHGVQIDGTNYLAAVDTPVDDQTDVEHGSLSLDRVIATMERSGSQTNLIVLDACRDNPWDRKWRGGPRGLAPVYAPRGTLIAFATSPGEVASDGSGRNGAYTSALLQHIDTPDVPVEAMFKRVRNTLSANTKAKQTSWEHTSLAGEFYFSLGVAARIDEYSPTAIKDRTFVLDPGKPLHRVIRALKSYNWYTQNPALEGLSAEQINLGDHDSLFVLGRNILQAANGSAAVATVWIKRFVERTHGAKPLARKCLLDGILLEIFFDTDGEFRKIPKTNRFNDAFELQQFEELQDSFDFIAGALKPEVHQFFALPGKKHNVSVDVVLDGEDAVTSVFFQGKDLLVAEEGDGFSMTSDTSNWDYRTHRRESFENELAAQMLVPRHLLNITYSKPGELSRLKVPLGFEIVLPE